jgi:hypothetical protein
MAMKRALALAALGMAVWAGSCLATESNFKPANMSGDAPAAEEHSRTRPAQQGTGEEGYLSKEWKRSGLAGVFGILDMRNWQNKQQS